ncbi:MAG: alkaline phosphatase family protein [Solirubrobacteraceae bacterium]
MRRALIPLVLLALVAPGALASPAAGAVLPPIRHVFVIVLENESANTTFGANSPASYLNGTLRPAGEFLPNYYGITHLSLGNYVAMVSGQASNPVTQADCQTYVDVLPGTVGTDGQASGVGCVYPSSVKTIADQLTAGGLTWKGYMEDMGNSSTAPATCRHPALNSLDSTQSARAGDQYAARHNPFVYFHSVIDSATCNQNDVPLDRLPNDLAAASTTPNLAFITPNLCNDGHDSPCKDGSAGGLLAADAFLRDWIPRIQNAPGYRDGGLIIVTFDEADSGISGDASACCHAPFPFPNSPNPGGTILGPGGGRTGSVLLSQYVQPGSVNVTPYNHFALLRSIEDLFGLGHLGYAASSDLKPFGDDVYNASASSPTTSPAPAPTSSVATGAAPPSTTTAATGPASTNGAGPGPSPTSGPAGKRHEPSCRHRAAPRARGSLRRGTLIQSLRVERTHGHSRLAVRVRHAGRLKVTIKSGRKLANRLVHACRTTLVSLPGGHRAVVLRISLRGRYERRRVRY